MESPKTMNRRKRGLFLALPFGIIVGMSGCGGSDMPANPVILTEPEDQTGYTQGTVTFSVKAEGMPPVTGYQWKKMAASATSDSDAEVIPGATGSELTYGPLTMADHGSVFKVEVRNRVGKAPSRSAVLTVKDATPRITADPVDQVVNKGAAAVFSVQAACPLNSQLSYQWQRMGANETEAKNIPNAMESTYKVPSATLSDHNAKFQVVVSSAYGSLTSKPANLHVLSDDESAPTITKSPMDAAVSVGGSHTFAVEFSGNPIPDLKWKRDGNIIEGQTGRTLVLTNIQPSDAGVYTLEAKNKLGTAVSDPARLSVEAQTYTVTFKVGDANGTLDGKTEIVQKVAPGGSATLVTATPKEGYKFNFWAIGSNRASADPALTLDNVTSDLVVTATFTNQSKLSVGALGVNIAGVDQTGQTVNLCDYFGNVILLDISTQWCGPCNEEAKKFEEYYQSVKGKGVKCLTVLTQNDKYKTASLDTVKAWVTKHGMTMRIQNDAAGAKTGPAEKCYVATTGGFPCMVVLDKAFNIRYLGGSLPDAEKTVAELVGR